MTDRNQKPETVLHIEDLCLKLQGKPILDHISFSVSKGERLGILGESGAGKSMTMYCLTSLLPQHGTKITGNICFGETDLLEIPYEKRREFCKNRVAIILQDSINALNPYLSIEKQWMETILLHHTGYEKIKKPAMREHIIHTMTEFGIEHPAEVMKKYPHQLSGGMKQRIAIAMALESDADILIADEPTTSLDSMNQRKIIEFIDELCRKKGLTLLYITHNLGIVSYLCDKTIVLRNGKKVEEGAVAEVFNHPKSSYAAELIHETVLLQEKMKWNN